MDMPDFDFYQNTYRGAVVKNGGAFDRLAARAGERLARAERVWRVTYTGENARGMAVCAVAEVLLREEEAAAPAVRAAASGQLSVTYDNPARPGPDQEAGASDHQLYRALRLYADVYRGV